MRKAATTIGMICWVVLTFLAVASLIQYALADPTPAAATAPAATDPGGLSERSWVNIALAVFATFQALLAYFVKSKLDSFMTKEACLARMTLCRHEEIDPLHRALDPLKETRATVAVRIEALEKRIDKMEQSINTKLDMMAQAITELRRWEG